jgi:hypothetical protein
LVNNTALRSPFAENLLEEWRLGLDRMRGHPPPRGFTERDWHQWKVDALELFAVHGPNAVALGWRTEELFGLHCDHPAPCVDASGLTRFIHGGSVIEITSQLARIRRRSGAVLTYRRTKPRLGAVPAWELRRENNMAFETTMELDTGAPELGPFLTWHVQENGVLQPGSFSIRENGIRTPLDLTEGFCFDRATSSIGWMLTSGQAGVPPQKRWSLSRAKLEPCPGDGWKKAFSVQIAYMQNGRVAGRAVWEQDSVAAFQSYVDIMALIRDTAKSELPRLPVLAFTGTRTVGKKSILVAQCRLIRYVGRPICLPIEDDQQGTNDENGASATAVTPKGNGSMNMAGKALTLPASGAPQGGGDLDDEIPFGPCVL